MRKDVSALHQISCKPLFTVTGPYEKQHKEDCWNPSGGSLHCWNFIVFCFFRQSLYIFEMDHVLLQSCHWSLDLWVCLEIRCSMGTPNFDGISSSRLKLLCMPHIYIYYIMYIYIYIMYIYNVYILHYVILYFIILYYIVLHCILYYSLLYNSLLYYIVFYYIIWYYIVLNIVLYYIILHYIILHYINLYYIIVYYFIAFYSILFYYIILYYYILFYFIILYYIILYHIILYYITYHVFNPDVQHLFPVLGTWEVFHDGQWVPGTAQDFVGRVVKGRKARPFLSCGSEMVQCIW